MVGGLIMNDQQQARFDALRLGPSVTGKYVQEYYGLTWPFSDDFREDFENWQRTRPKPSVLTEDSISRYELEKFMQQQSVIPKMWMGARLGMDVDSLKALLDGLKKIGMPAHRYNIYSDLVSDALSEDIVSHLPGLKFRTFSDQHSFCERLHCEISEALNTTVKPLFCATSTMLKEYPRLYASYFDCITLAPLSGTHQMWLDFKKPLNLRPDRCSKLFYAANRQDMKPFCAGSTEPDEIDEYTRLLGGISNEHA
jgi:hypothetical protein